LLCLRFSEFFNDEFVNLRLALGLTA